MENYGGMLQNYALQQALIGLGHQPVTIDWLPKLKLKWYVRGIARTLLKGVPYRPYHRRRLEVMDSFAHDYLKLTPTCWKHGRNQLDGMDAVIVGSDQVWRPGLGLDYLYDMFLRFAGDFEGRRIAYAASFGTNSWNVSDKVRSRCAVLAAKINPVSVRESSGIDICTSCLGIDAVQMPDPVFLLDPSSYLNLCKDIPVNRKPYLAAYILDSNDKSETAIQKAVSETGLPVIRCTSGAGAKLSVQEWIAMFRDAQYVVTDSFHGVVLSRMLGKDCAVIVNENRGKARFDSVMGVPDLALERKRGLNFLKEALQ